MTHRVVLILGVLAIAGLAFWRVIMPSETASTGSAPSGNAAATPRHVLLVTIDTLRADRVGAYGYSRARTPTLDGLAARGVRFTRAYATAPITLTSHATLLTGLYPPGHGARHNGVAMDAGPRTLAETFKQAGFETAAFVSAFPLDKRFGLARGFDVYDDEMPRGGDRRHANERQGAATIDRAVAWLRTRPASGRVFVWVHLFEPHAPYGTPGLSPQRDVSERYDEEVAIADAEIGRLLNTWPDLWQTLVVAAADHGEAFGEHREIGHSIFIYDTTLRVPLIVAGPGVPATGALDAPVTVADVAPTVTSLMGLRAMDADGVDLRSILGGGAPPSRALYAESFAPLLDFGWAPLRSLRRDGIKVIAAPRSELFDVAGDPDETSNVIGERRPIADEFLARVDRISPPALPARSPSVDAEAAARLRALGYATGGSTRATTRADPKDRIDVASRMASVTSGELRGAAAEQALTEVLRDDSGNPQAHQRLGFVLAESGRCPAAEPHFAAAIAGGLPSADPYLGLARCQASRGGTADALRTLRDARRVEPGNPVVDANIGLTALQLGRVDEAISALNSALAIDPDLHQARFALARALARTGRREAALQEATTLLGRLPASAPQRPEVERLITALR